MNRGLLLFKKVSVLSILAIFCGSSDWIVLRPGSSTKAQNCGYYMEEFVVPPHGKNDLEYNYTFVATQLWHFQLDVKFKYYRDSETITFPGEGNYRDEVILPRTKWNPEKIGEKFTVAGVFELKYAWEEYHFMIAYVYISAEETANDQDIQKTRNFIYPKSVQETIVPSDFPWKRKFCQEINLQFGGTYHYLGNIRGGEQGRVCLPKYGIDGSGFKSEYTDPEFGIFPMKYYFLGYGYWGEEMKVDWKKGELRIYSHVADFNVGKIRYDKELKEYYVTIDVVPHYTNGRTYIAFKNKMYVSADGRECTDKSYRKPNNSYETNKLFLPPNPTSASRTYDCVFKLEDFGQNLSDRFEYSFTVTKNHNLLGPSSYSDFELMEVY